MFVYFLSEDVAKEVEKH